MLEKNKLDLHLIIFKISGNLQFFEIEFFIYVGENPRPQKST